MGDRVVVSVLLQTRWRAPWLLASVLAVLAPPASAQGETTAGHLLMSIGKVSTVRDGRETPAPRGTVIQVGDLVRTGPSSNAQLKLNDGALIALRPNSDFKVNAFNYNGKADGSENASLSLLKGGVRAVTGAIGHTHRDNLKIDAVVATIGIRGTGFNIVLCDEACRAASQGAKSGLYAGVFEGRIVVSNQSGAATEMGVNQFVYVADGKTPPARLVAPPALLQDKLEGQRQVKSTEPRAAAAVAAATTSTETQRTADKAPVQGLVSAGDITTAVNQATAAVTLQPVSTGAQVPSKFYDQAGGDLAALVGTKPAGTNWALQSAEFNPNGTQRRADNQVIEGVNGTVILGFTQYDGYKVQSVAQNGTTVYAIRNSYTGAQQEGGADGGVIAWGRWAGGSALIGNYGTVNYTGTQGFHWIVGAQTLNVPTAVANQSFTFNLIGATMPTEAAAGAQSGWRVSGGSLTANFGSANVAVNGLLNLFLLRSGGSGNFNMNFSGSSSGGSIASTAVTTSVVRTQGDIALCVSSCAGAGAVAFYGAQATHAGMTYEFNTGASYVQGAAAFKR